MNQKYTDEEILSLLEECKLYTTFGRNFTVLDLYGTASKLVSYLEEKAPSLLLKKERFYNAFATLARQEFQKFTIDNIFTFCAEEKFIKILEYIDKPYLFKIMRLNLDEDYAIWKLLSYINLKCTFNYNEDNDDLFDCYKQEIAFLLNSSEVKNTLIMKGKVVFRELMIKCLSENLIDIDYMKDSNKHLLSLFPDEFNDKELLLKLNYQGLNININENNLASNLFIEGKVNLLCTLIDINNYNSEEIMGIKDNLKDSYNSNPHFQNPMNFFGDIEFDKNFEVIMHALDMKIIERQKKEIGEKIKNEHKKTSGKRI